MAGVKTIDPAACEPVPNPEFCDQSGMLYVSGYTILMKNDMQGSCWFLHDHRCRIYNRRFFGCRIYPHMLRRGRGPGGTVTWQKFARRNEHGQYKSALSFEDCLVLAGKIREYENAFLTQQISFLETVFEYFTVHELRHDPMNSRNN